MESESPLDLWRTQLLIAAGVILAVVAALLLAGLDAGQRRSTLPPRPLPVVDVSGTIAAGELALVPLPSATPTPTRPAVAETQPANTNPAAAAVAVLPRCGEVPPGWEPYEVELGDSVALLALRFGVSMQAINQANCLDVNRLLPGLTLFLPATPSITVATVTCGPPLNWIKLRVRVGDTLSALARLHSTTVVRLKQANCLDSTTLTPGIMIYVPPRSLVAPGLPSRSPSIVSPPASPTRAAPWLRRTPRPSRIPPESATATVPTAEPTASSTPVPPGATETSPAYPPAGSTATPGASPFLPPSASPTPTAAGNDAGASPTSPPQPSATSEALPTDPPPATDPPPTEPPEQNPPPPSQPPSTDPPPPTDSPPADPPPPPEDPPPADPPPQPPYP